MATVAERLQQRWGEAPGLASWVKTVDHKKIGRRYIWTAFGFFLLAGLEALAVRTQLARPGGTLLDPDTYNQLFTMHGTTMIFLFATPMGHQASGRTGRHPGSAIGAHYRHTTPEMAARVMAAVEERLVVVLGDGGGCPRSAAW